MEVVAQARTRGMTVIALTSRPTSALARAATITLSTAGPALPEGRHPNQTAGPPAHLAAVRALAEAVAWRQEHEEPRLREKGNNR